MAAATTKNNNLKTSEGLVQTLELKVAASTTLYKGRYVNLASGFITNAVDTSGHRFAGIVEDGADMVNGVIDNSAGSNGDKKVVVRVRGRVLATFSSIAESDVPVTVYALFNNEFALAAGSTNKIAAGVLVERVSSTTGWVELKGIGTDTSDLSVATADIQDGAVTGAKLGAASLKFAKIAGGAAGALTVTGIATADHLVAVMQLDRDATAANIDIMDLTSEFTITGANTIDNTGGTNTTGNSLAILYINDA